MQERPAFVFSLIGKQKEPAMQTPQTVDKVGVKLLVSHPLFLFSHNFIMRP